MRCVQLNTGKRQDVDRFFETSANIDVGILQDCSEEPLQRLTLAGAAVFQTSHPSITEGGLIARKRIDAAIVLTKVPADRIYGLTPVSTTVAGVCLLPQKEHADQTKWLILSAYIRPFNTLERGKTALKNVLRDIDAMIANVTAPFRICLGGDFNMPDGPWSTCTDRREEHAALSDKLMEWATSRQLGLATPTDIVTFHSATHQTDTTIDLTFSSLELSDFRAVADREFDHSSLYYCLPVEQDVRIPRNPLEARDVDMFKLPLALHHFIKNNTAATSQEDQWVLIVNALKEAIAASRTNVDKDKVAPRKRKVDQRLLGWSSECDDLYKRRAERSAQIAATKFPGTHPSKSDLRIAAQSDATYRALDSQFGKAKKRADDEAMEAALADLTKKEHWLCLTTLRHRKKKSNPLSPPFEGTDGARIEDVETKVDLLVSCLYPRANAAVETAATEPKECPSRTGLDAVTESEMKAIIKEMDGDKAAGPDGVRPCLLKQLFDISDTFRERLLELTNNCVQQATFPNIWKLATICVIPKLGRRNLTLPKSYRPISLLCTVSKAVESIICHRLQHALASKGQLRKQFGSVPGISVVHAVGSILDSGRDSIRDKMHTAILTIDVSSAFNQVDHDRLRGIFDDLGLTSFGRWIAAWLCNRRFKLLFEGHMSESFHMGDRGVPQGSPLSPLLWALYVDSVFVSPAFVRPPPLVEGAYVDDLFAVIASETVDHLFEDCQAWIDKIKRWGDERDISFDKPSFLIASGTAKKRKELGERTLKIGENVITTSQSTVIVLGVEIGVHFRLKEFVRNKCRKTVHAANLLHWSMAKAGTTDAPMRLRIAKAVLFPVLDYAAALHPLVIRQQETDIGQAEKAIYAFVLGAWNSHSLPSGVALSHELGQLTTVVRWRRQSMLHLGRLLTNPKHSSSVDWEEKMQQVRDGDADNYGEGNLTLPLKGPLPRGTVLIAPLISPLRVAARSFPFEAMELIGLPKDSPSRWATIRCDVKQRDEAIKTESVISKMEDKHSIRLYADGSETESNLGAAVQAYMFNGSASWSVSERLDHDQWDIIEAEVHAILLALELCVKIQGSFLTTTDDTSGSKRIVQEGSVRVHKWKRIDIFSDSQQALHRISASWHKDRSHLQHLTHQIRETVRALSKQTSEIVLRWVPGHANVAGNVKADALAKATASLEQPKADFGSFALLQRIALDTAQTTQRISWEYCGSQSLQEFTPVVDFNNMQLLSGVPSSMFDLLVKVRSNTWCVASHRDEDKTVCMCEAPKQDRDHLLLHCPLTEPQRARLQSFLPEAERQSIRAFLQGGHYEGDKDTKRRYMGALEALLRQANKVLVDTNIANGVFTRQEAQMIEASGGSRSDSFIEPISTTEWEVQSNHEAEAEDEDGGMYGLREQTTLPPPQETEGDSSGSIHVVAESVPGLHNAQGENTLVVPGTWTRVERPILPPRRPRRNATAEDAIVLSDSEDSDSSVQVVEYLNEHEIHDSDDF